MADTKPSHNAEPTELNHNTGRPSDDVKKVDTQAQEEAAKERAETGGYE